MCSLGLCLVLLLIRTLILLDQGPTLMTSLNLIISLKTTSPNMATLRFKASKYEFGGNTSIECTIPTTRKLLFLETAIWLKI